MHARDNQAPRARPLAQESPFEARPVAHAAETPKAIEVCYPLVMMPRSRAALDLVVMVLIFIAAQFLIVLSGVLWLLMEWWPQYAIFATNVLLGVLTLGAIGTLLTLRRQSPKTIGLNRASRKRVAVAVLIAVPASFMAGALSNLLYIAASGFDFSGFIEERSEFFGVVPEVPLIWILAFSLFVGIHEEVFFRGFLLSRLRTACGSNAAAIILTSAIFGSLHFYQGLAGVFQTAAVGLVLALVVTYARTLWPAIIAHACFDTIGILLAGPLSDALRELPAAPA